MHAYQIGRHRTAGRDPYTENEMSTPNRISWDAKEKRKLAIESYRILQKDPNLSQLEAVNRAQQRCLAEDRRRTVQSFGKFSPWIVPMWDEITQQKQAKAKAEDLFEPTAERTPELAPLELVPQEILASEVTAERAAQDIPESVPPVNVDSPAEPDVVQAPLAHLKPYLDPAPATPQPVEGQRPMVRWVDSEKKRIAQGVYRRIEEGRSLGKPIERLEALRMTVEQDLEPDRQRNITTWVQVEGWLDAALKDVKNEAILAEARAREEQARQEREEAERQVEAELATARAEIERQQRVEETERTVQQRMGALSYEMLIRLFARRLAHDVIDAIQGEMHAGLTETLLDKLTTPDAPPAPPPESPTVVHAEPTQPNTPLPRVTVVGLEPPQEDEVRRALLGSLDIVFVRSAKRGGHGHGAAGMLTKSTKSTVAIILADQAGPDVEQARKSLTVPHVRINGGKSSLMRWISAWMAGTIELPAVDAS